MSGIVACRHGRWDEGGPPSAAVAAVQHDDAARMLVTLYCLGPVALAVRASPPRHLKKLTTSREISRHACRLRLRTRICQRPNHLRPARHSFRGQRKVDREDAAAAWQIAHLNLTAVRSNGLACDGEPEAEAGTILAASFTECLKQVGLALM